MTERFEWESGGIYRGPPPTFIGIGGHKCASTWLSECLRDHPDIFVTDPKETGFFLDHKNKGFGWYAAHFHASGGYKARGEFTSYYLYDQSVPSTVREALGVLRVIAVVRNPIARSLSQIKHGIRLGVCSVSQSGEVSLSDLHLMIEQYPVILSRSLYFEGLSAWMEVFGKSNVLVLDQFDFGVEPEQCLRQVFRFLHVDDGFIPARVKKEVSRGINPRWNTFERLRIRLYSGARSVPGMVPFLRKTRLPELYRRLNSGQTVTLSKEANDWLLSYTQEDWDRTKNLCWRPVRGAR